jgi:hypothetical protein
VTHPHRTALVWNPDRVSPVAPEEDPGWKLSPRLLLFILPGYMTYHARRRGGLVDGLETIRQVWVSFSSAAVLFGVAVLIVVPGTPTRPVSGWIAGLALLTIGCLLTHDVISRRDIEGTDLTSLAQGYRTRFFIQAALAEGIALFAFVGTFVTGEWWLYWLFLPFTLFGYARHAPTASHLRGEQDRLRDRGITLSLVAALRGTAPT